MTEEEKRWVLTMLDAIESLFSENAALKVTLEHHRVAPRVYERECRELIEHPGHAGLARAKFADLRAYIEQAHDDSKALKELLKVLPKPNKYQN